MSADLVKDRSVRLAPANRTLLADQVTIAIRKAIIDSSFPPGTRLIEGDLAESLKVSRGPVREALRRLEQEGLVRIVPARGTFVATVAEEDIAEIYGLRAALETYAAGQAACGADLRDLEESVSEMRAAFDAGDLPKLIEADLHFHGGLVALANNRRLLGVWMTLEGQMRLILSLTRDQVYRDPQHLTDEHRRLLETIRSGDAQSAAQRIREHIEGRIGERLAHWREIASRNLEL